MVVAMTTVPNGLAGGHPSQPLEITRFSFAYQIHQPLCCRHLRHSVLGRNLTCA
jgi:hypothetical protein